MSTTAVSISSLKDEVQATIEERSGAFVRLAHDIHAHPEETFAERYAAARVTMRVGRHDPFIVSGPARPPN